MIKRFTVNLLIIFITFMGVIYGYTQSFGLSFYDRYRVYADDNTTNRQDLIDSFTAYCRSRNLFIDGTVLGSAAEWTGSTLNNIIQTLGIDNDYLQAQINKEISGNLGVRYLISASGIGLYNRIFAELLQREDISVDQTDVNKKVYSGIYYTDPDGNKALVWVFPTQSNQSLSSLKPIYYGDYYKYSSSQLYQFYLNGVIPSYHFGVDQSDATGITSRQDPYYTIYQFSYDYNLISDQIRNERLNGGNVNADGSRIIGMVQGSDTLYFGSCCYFWDLVNPDYPDTYYAWGLHVAINTDNGSKENTDVTVSTPDDDPVLPDLPENPTTIYPTGNTEPDDDPVSPDPSGPSLPDWGTDTEVNPRPDGDGWDIPFSMPNLNIDWSLKDIGHKFPFCIPSDIVSFYRTLSVEPEAPSIDAHIPLGSFYDWHFVADFSQYDRWAVIIRAVEYVGFVIGLIYFTVRLVKG